MSTVTRDTVLLAGDDTDHDLGVALGLDSFPGDGMTLGDLVDEANQTRGDLERLIHAMTGGAMSKARWAEDTDAVIARAAPVAMRAFVYEYPHLLKCDPFRQAVENEFGFEELHEMDLNARLSTSGAL